MIKLFVWWWMFTLWNLDLFTYFICNSNYTTVQKKSFIEYLFSVFLLYTQSYCIPPFWHTDTSHVSIQPNEETHRLNKIFHVTHIKSLSATKQIVVTS